MLRNVRIGSVRGIILVPRRLGRKGVVIGKVAGEMVMGKVREEGGMGMGMDRGVGRGMEGEMGMAKAKEGGEMVTVIVTATTTTTTALPEPQTHEEDTDKEATAKQDMAQGINLEEGTVRTSVIQEDMAPQETAL
jgi:hypothetical protein